MHQKLDTLIAVVTKQQELLEEVIRVLSVSPYYLRLQEPIDEVTKLLDSLTQENEQC